MGLSLDFAEVIEAAQAEVTARAEREAAAAGLTVDQLWARQRAADEAEERQARHLAATQERAERISAISPGLTAAMAQAVTQGALTDGPEWSAHAHVRRWLNDPASKPVLILAGGTGTGKTVACAWALAKMGGEYVRAIDLPKRFEPFRGEAEALNVAGHELLVLDDLGTETRSGDGRPDRRFMPALYDIVDQRQGVIRRGTRWLPRRTLITTNVKRGEFKSKYADERILSRLRQCARWVALDGADMRSA